MAISIPYAKIGCPTRLFWANQLLLEWNMPISLTNQQALVAWMSGENTKAVNNPLATKYDLKPNTDFNSVGVKSYPTFADGLLATTLTLDHTGYQGIKDALASGHHSAGYIVLKIEGSPWGTKDIPLDAVLAGWAKGVYQGMVVEA